MELHRVTQKTIAQKLGLTQAAVSLALRNDPSIPRETCKRVAAVARELNYIPDPFLSGLASYRKRVRKANFQGTLGWLSNFSQEDWKPRGWRSSATFRDYHAGALQQARERCTRLKSSN